MTLEKLDQIEKKIIEERREVIKNIDNFIQNRFLTKDEKIDIKLNAIEIFENSLRMIKEQKQKLRGEKWRIRKN